MITPVSRHLDLYHRFNTKNAHFYVLEVVPQDPRGGDWNQHILQRESLWIERLNATLRPGLNEAQSDKPFL